MRCNPWRWLWALPLLVLWWWITYLSEHQRIEADLRQRTEAAFKAAGQNWAAVSFSGRDGVLRGRAEEDRSQVEVADLARNTWGVRIVEDRTQLIDEQKNYAWSAAFRDNRIKLSGFVPNETTRRAIIGSARASFPNLEVDDRMELARGAPNRDVWLGGIGFGLKQLAQLKGGGRVDLDAGGNLQVEGEAQSFNAYRSVKTALAGGLPSGIKLKSDRVSAPVVSPYTFAAKRGRSQLELTGHAPSERARGDIVTAAKKAMPNLAIVDTLQIANGAPNGWAGAAQLAIDSIAQLEEGEANLRDAQLAVSGVAQRQVTAESVQGALRRPPVTGFRISDQITYREPTLKTVSPFETRLSAQASRIVITGYAPSDAARKALIDAVQARFPGKRVDSQMELAAGAPAGWQACAIAGVNGVSRFGTGDFAMRDNALTVSAETTDEALHGSFPGALRASVNRACEADARIALKAIPEPDLKWTATRGEQEVLLEGEVPDSSIKARLAELAGQLFAGKSVVDRTRVTPTPSRHWGKTAELGLTSLSRLRTGSATITGTVLTMTGEAPDAAAATAVRKALGSNLTGGYQGRDILQVRSDSMIWADQEAKRKAEAERAAEDARKQAAEDAERQRLADEARKKAEAERQRLADEARTKAEAERQRLAEETRKKAEAERLRLAEEARTKAEAERQRLAEEARKKAEAERQRLADEARKKAEAEKQRLAEAEARRCQDALRAARSAGTIRFARASAELDAASFPTLDQLVAAARQCKDVTIEIEGHTDNEGTPERNQRLSERRAQSVAAYLAKAGLAADQLRAIGYGESQPVAPNETPEGRSQNRRIDFTVKTR